MNSKLFQQKCHSMTIRCAFLSERERVGVIAAPLYVTRSLPFHALNLNLNVPTEVCQVCEFHTTCVEMGKKD